MEWTEFLTVIVQVIIAVLVAGGVLFVGSAAWSAVKDQMNKNN